MTEDILDRRIGRRLLRDRVESQPNGCWEWSGFRLPNQKEPGKGYGFTSRGGKGVLAHRLIWIEANGAIPDGKLVLHHCDNRCCVNPDHLYLGTPKDNMLDMVRRGRRQQLLGAAVPSAKLDEATVRLIRSATGTISQIAAQFGIASTTAWMIRQRRTWKHI